MDNEHRRRTIISAYQMHLHRQPNKEEILHHYNSTIATDFINMHIRNSEEAKKIRNVTVKKMRCCRR